MPDSEDRKDEPVQDVSRRAFLAAGMGAAGATALSFYWCREFGDPARRAEIDPTPPGAPGRTFDAGQMRTAEAACARLLPSSADSPGATEVGAARYIDALLATTFVDADKKGTIVDGLAKLDQRVRADGARDFARATAAQQDAAIRVFETFRIGKTYPGHAWLRLMLRYTLEAFLGDPVHGGNPGGIGWKAIGHKPPLHRPTQPNWRPTPKDAR